LDGRPGDELARVALDDLLLRVDGDERVEVDGVRMRDRLKVAAAAALAPPRGGDAAPVGIGRRRRQDRLDAREHALGAREQRGSASFGTSRVMSGNRR
jgi:hypothetical protein